MLVYVLMLTKSKKKWMGDTRMKIGMKDIKSCGIMPGGEREARLIFYSSKALVQNSTN